ncbi:MAG: hypothetical protein Q9170_007340 [Blastenia crenularia]
MVLGYGNFTGLSSREYRAKLREAKLEDLRREEIRKIRNRIASVWSVASGIGWAYFTFGGSLVVSGIGGRKWRVADRKLEMIREELIRRGEKVHKLDWKDVAIPITSCALGTAAGAGIDVGIGSLINIGDIAASGAGGNSMTGGGNHNDELQAVFAHPARAVQGVGEGAVMQPDLVAHGGGLSMADALGVPPNDVPVQTIDFDTSEINSRLAELSGAQLGAEMSTSVERGAGQLAAQELAWWIMESFEDPQWRHEAASLLGCIRYVGSSDLTCNGCGSEISQGLYWHCCKCQDDDFDLCNSCYDSGSRCDCKFSDLRQLQFAWASIYQPQGEAAFQLDGEWGCNVCRKRCGQIVKQGVFYRRFVVANDLGGVH